MSEHLKRLAAHAAREVELTREIEVKESELTALKAERTALRREAIPKILSDMGVSSLTAQGYEVSIDTKLNGTLAKSPDPEKAIAYLREEGQDDVIQTSITVPLAKGDNRGALVVDVLRDTLGLAASVSDNVNASTLAAFARRKLKAGETIDLKLLGLSQWTEAKVKEG